MFDALKFLNSFFKSFEFIQKILFQRKCNESFYFNSRYGEKQFEINLVTR